MRAHRSSLRGAAMSRHVAVIGAGIVGTLCAIEALRDNHRVTIIEPGEPGGEQAASFGNSGWLSSHSVIPPAEPGVWKRLPHYLADPLGPVSIRWRHALRASPWLLRYCAAGASWERVARTARALRTLLADAPQLHRDVAQRAGAARFIACDGVLHVYRSRAEFERDSMAWRLRHEAGVRWREWDADAVRAREPALDARYHLGILVEEAGQCRDPGAYTRALFDHALHQGAAHVRTDATGLRIERRRLRAVITGAGDVDCDAAVIAAGARSAAIAAAAGDRIPLECERGYHVMIRDPEARPRLPVMAADCKTVATMMEGGLRVGGQVEIAAFDDAPNWRRAEVLRRHALSMFPALPRDLGPERVRCWLGRRPSTPDGLPCIGPARATQDVVHAFGHGHVGLAAAARTARLVAQLLDERETDIPLAPFDPARFRRSATRAAAHGARAAA
jgi:D-amino-acid dehydrogenase